MRTTFLILGALCCLASWALAGPNAGGVLWVHDVDIVQSDTGPPVLPPPADCAQVDNQIPMGSDPYAVSEPRYWRVYAAFPAASSPRLKGCGWGVGQPGVSGGQVVIWAAEAPSPDVFYLTSFGWPGDNTFIGMSFTGPARLDPVTELFWFAGYAYAGAAGEPQSFCLIPHGAESNRIFVDDGSPRHEDPIIDYGCLGFGTSGYTPCPVPDLNTLAACCSPEGECALTTEADCPPPSIWHPAEYDCWSNPCLPPVPTERTSWGGIKAIFR